MTEPHRPRYRYFSFHESVSRWLYVFFSIPIVIGIVWSISSHAELLPILWLTLLPLIALTDREVEIDTVSHTLVTRWMPYRLFTIWKTTEPLARYEAVTSRRGSDGHRGAASSPLEREWLMLVRTTGKFRSVQFFNARKKEICPEGQAAVRRLMDATGLPYRPFLKSSFAKA